MWDYFREPQLDLKVKNKVEGPLEVKNIMERNYYFVSEHARDVSNPMFWGMANHLGRFLGASGPSEGQEQVGGAVGGEAQVLNIPQT